MSTSRYPDNNRYAPRDRSPPYRDRRPSNFGGGYPPRGGEPGRPTPEPSGFQARDAPRGPKSVGDAPRGPALGAPSAAPAAPRDERGRAFAGRGEATPLRNAPPLSSGPAPPLHNSHNSWRADRDRDRDFDRRERRPTPPRRSPIRDLRDSRDQRDFGPRDLDVSRARRNSRDGPPSAGSTYSDPPLGSGSSYRGSGIGRGRGGFAGRGRIFHNDERDRHHDPRDRVPERTYRPRSRSPPGRRERDVREERDFDRRDRDDRRFVPREYDSYIGPAGAAKPGLRALDTHRGPGPSESRHLPGTPTGVTPHASLHASPSDRGGQPMESYSRRSSVAVEPLSAKETRRDPGKDEALLASRAEASRERYAPRPSSPPASIPAFGGSHVWKAPVPETKPSSAAIPSSKPAQIIPAIPSAASTPSTSIAPVAPIVLATPVSATVPDSVPPTSNVPTAPKSSIPTGLSTIPPTGPKADRLADKPASDALTQEARASTLGPLRMEPPSNTTPAVATTIHETPRPGVMGTKFPVTHPLSEPTAGTSVPGPPSSAPPAPSGLARSPPQGPALKIRAPPVAPQAILRPNASPSFPRAFLSHHGLNDPSSVVSPSTNAGARSGGGGPPSMNTSPKSLPANIPTGPKADRTPMASRPPAMYPPTDRPIFPAPRAPMGGGAKSMQWVRPGLIPNRASIPSKRELPSDDREKTFGTIPKAPRLENSVSATQSLHVSQAKSVSPLVPRGLGPERPRERAASAERTSVVSSKPTPIETRRHSDVVMGESSPCILKPPVSAASSAPEVLQDSDDDDLDLDEDDFAESEAKYNRERARLEAKRIDLTAPHLRATSPLQEIVLLSCLHTGHLPQRKISSQPIDAKPAVLPVKVASGLQEEALSETVIADLPTPRAEESEDIGMDDNSAKDRPDEVLGLEDIEGRGERTTAPATLALRLRRGMSTDEETHPDLSALPYLGSGPPTPLSDIGQDRPSFSESVMASIRDKLRKSIEPELTTEETLRQYASIYKQWRLAIRPWDDERDHDDHERQPSVEPTLKALTPDVQSVAMTGILDGSLAPTGRRSHASRWATELDIEAVLKESLKTAEEERIGKQEKEPSRALADPEKEAALPVELTESEAERRRYIDTNFQREPGQGIFVFHYEPPEDDFTEEEHQVMVHNYKDQYAKKWGKLAEVLYKEVGTERTYKDCINHYYATKWGKEYKGKIKGRRGGVRKRGGGVARGRAAIANMDRPDNTGEDGVPMPVTETGRPRRSAAPTFGGTEVDIDPGAGTPTPGRARRQTDADGTQDKSGRRGKGAKEKPGRKTKNLPLAAAPVGSPVKMDRKEKGLGVKTEDEYGKRLMAETPPLPIHAGLLEEPTQLVGDPQFLVGLPSSLIERPKTLPHVRPGPSSYWSVSELQDFDKNVAHFGTDWLAIANHMGTKTHTMIKNQYLRLVEGGRMELEQVAKEADARRERGEDLGPPPTPTPAPKRRYESTQTAPIRQIAPTPEHKSPVMNAVPLPQASPPHVNPAARFPSIAQAPIHNKPLTTPATFPSLPESSIAPAPSMPSQQSPPTSLPRSQPQHHHQHSLSQHKPQQPGPRAGYFSDDLPGRLDNRPPSQPITNQQGSRSMQQHGSAQTRAQELHHSPMYRNAPYQERDHPSRPDVQQDRDGHRQYQVHARRISHELPHQRPFVPGGAPPLMPPGRPTAADLRSPEHRPLSYSHSRHVSQTQPVAHSSHDVFPHGHKSVTNPQHQPSRASIMTPPVKEEPRNLAPSVIPQGLSQPIMHTSHQHMQHSQSAIHGASSVAPAKPAAEPRKSNLMSLLNDDGPEEPRRKKLSDQGPPSHTPTPQQSAPIAPPPPPPTSQGYPSAARRNLYDDVTTTQPSYTRPSYAQQSALPPSSVSRPIDLTSEQSSTSRQSSRENWQQRQPFHTSQSQQPSSLATSQSGLPQPFLANHRSVLAQYNAPRHNPSPPPVLGYANSPHLHSRTPSVSGAPTQSQRHAIPSTTATQHSQAAAASAQILQPNPYAQVDPPGSAPPPGPMGMRPSPHLHTSHLTQQRELGNRNEHSQVQNAGLTFSNPPTPNEHSGHTSLRGPSNAPEPFRPRDTRDTHGIDPRSSDRDTSRELSQRADFLREQHSTPALRSTGALLHEELRYQPQDRAYLSQRSQTPLSRMEHSQPPPLQHPPHSSLGVANHPMYGQRSIDEPQHRYAQPLPRDRSIADRMREDQAQQQAAMSQDDLNRQNEREARERGLRERDVQFRDSRMRPSNFGGPPPPPPGSQPEQRQEQRLPGSMDWVSAVRHPQDRGGWPR
ncbi:hypothetical protein ACN47E_008081 [Coniothyrium glycines]